MTRSGHHLVIHALIGLALAVSLAPPWLVFIGVFMVLQSFILAGGHLVVGKPLLTQRQDA